MRTAGNLGAAQHMVHLVAAEIEAGTAAGMVADMAVDMAADTAGDLELEEQVRVPHSCPRRPCP